MADVDAPQIETLRANVEAKRGYSLLKRLIDFAAALILLILLALPMLAVAIAVKLSSPGPILYRTPRRGLNGKPFTMLKFRSMRVVSPEEDDAFRASVREGGVLAKSSDDPRVTKLGRWMRARSVDELPQLLNVLAGDMALIGPRPVMLEMLHPYPNFAQARSLVRPGLGGLWQVRARSDDTSVVHMWQHDLEYISEMGLRLDLRLALQTAAVAIRGTGAR